MCASHKAEKEPYLISAGSLLLKASDFRLCSLLWTQMAVGLAVELVSHEVNGIQISCAVGEVVLIF